MGCLKFIVKVIIVIFAIIGFKSVGGWDWIKTNIHPFEKPSQESLVEKSMDVADFSKIPEEYELSKSTNILGFRAVIAEHDASGQKMAVVNENKKIKLSQEDFKNGKLENKINDINQKLHYQYVHVENFKIVSQGTMQTMGQSAPYARFEADVTNLPMKHIKGVVAVAKDNDGKSKILVSANQGDKYSQIIAEQFFRKVKLPVNVGVDKITE